MAPSFCFGKYSIKILLGYLHHEEEEERNAEQETPGGTLTTCVRAQPGGHAEDITMNV